MIRKNVVYFLMFSVLFFSGCPDLPLVIGDDDDDSGGDSDGDADGDSDGDADGDGDSPFDCDGASILDYGLKSMTIYAPDENDNDEWVVFQEIDLEYDDQGQRTAYLMRLWENGEIIYTSDRTYKYNDDGQLESLDWVQDGSKRQRQYHFNNQDRISQELWIYDFEGDPFNVIDLRFEYGSNGRVSRYLDVNEEEPSYSFGREFTYDDQGRLKRTDYLSIDNGDWVPAEGEQKYEYDSLGRLAKLTSRDIDPVTDQLVTTTTTCEYADESGTITNCEEERDGVLTTKTYQWDGLELTVTAEVETKNRAEILSMETYSFTKVATSSYYEITRPLPVYFWTWHLYGNGYINGCYGF